MKRGSIPEIWTARNATDESRHSAACRVCREGLRPYGDQKLYGVKNARTREFVHVLVNDESPESKLGWPREEVLYSIMLENGSRKGLPMPEETKKKLKEVNQLRRSLRRTPANTPARPVEGEIKEEAMTKKGKGKMVGRRMFVFGSIPATKVMLWMGKRGFGLEEARTALKAAGIQGGMPTDRHIRDCLKNGKSVKESTILLTAEQQKILGEPIVKKAIKKPVKKTIKRSRGDVITKDAMRIEVKKESSTIEEVPAEKVTHEAV